MQECSWMQGAEYARPQSPSATRRRWKWPRNSSHSASVGVRYSSLGRAARSEAGVKVRQPLSEAVVVADTRERAAIERLVDVVREELNVREVRFVEAADVASLHEQGVDLRIDSAAAHALPKPGGGAPVFSEDPGEMKGWHHWAHKLSGHGDWQRER